MKSKLIIIFGMLILALSAGVIFKTVISGEASSSNYEKKLSKGSVTVSLQPVQVTGNTIKFKLSMNTHSVSLEKLDLKKIITLQTDSNEIHPVKVPSFTSHHGSGIIIFKIKKPLKRITVTIRDVPDVPKRIFKWDLK